MQDLPVPEMSQRLLLLKKIPDLRKEINTAWLKLHLIVLIYGFTAILGKLIELPALELVWYRMMFAIVTFFIYLKYKGLKLEVSRRSLVRLLLVGVIIAVHWVTFFGAIKLANVSVALGGFATTTLFTSFLEPFFHKKKINVYEVIIGLIIILGIYLIFRFETRYTLGILVSLLSAFLAGLFTVINKKLVAHHEPVQISFYEMIGGWSAITLFLLFSGKGIASPMLLPSWSDLVYLLLLATVCTAYAHTTQVEVMKHLSAFTVTLTINLEPVYGILMAFFIFGETERMTAGFYAGTLVILLSVVGFPLSQYYKRKKRREANRIG